MSCDPVLIAYGVTKSKDGKRNFWKRIGEAYPHRDGAGLTVQLNVLPLDGRIILLERDAADDRRLEAEAKRFATQSKARKGRSP
ncbi:MAG: hypothetical protein ACLPPF_21435 [Rhodomicrobium sp.]